MLPDKGRSRSDILAELVQFGAHDPAYKDGRLWSLTYHLDDSHERFLGEAYQLYAGANGLNPGAFKSLRLLEGAIIEDTLSLLNAPPGAAGVLTSGGTESCLLAVKTYRDLARVTRGVRHPEMVVPATAHVAWRKGSEYFGVKLRVLPLDGQLHADATRLDGLINRNTVMVLASAPEYPHGSIDPVEALAHIAQSRGVPLHVDACVGGFILPFMEQNGVSLPLWDYRVPGVTSISADVHKYGYASKGASTISYRSHDILKHQMFVDTEWPGGVFASAALLGTRPGGAYAAAWAAMQFFGRVGYQDLARRTFAAFSSLRNGIEQMDGLVVLGQPSGPLLAYGSADPQVNIFAVGDAMEAKGWGINRCHRPDGLHAMVTAQHEQVVPRYLDDLRDAVAVVRANPAMAQRGSAATYGMVAHVPMRGLVRRQVLEMFSAAYRRDATTPVGMPAEDPEGTAPKPLLERLARWYVARRQAP